MTDAHRFARRRLLKAAAFGPTAVGSSLADRPSASHANGEAPHPHSVGSDTAGTYRTVTGTITDISPHVIAVGDGITERRFALTADATAWRGGPLEPSALGAGDEVVIRLLPSRPTVADRIWANIGRVTGTIMRRAADHVVVAESTSRLRTVIIPPHATGRIQVRFPNLHPGYLIDLIGVRRQDYLEGIIPATSQPPYRSDLIPSPNISGRPSETITGSAVWHESDGESDGVGGVLYPAIDPATRCAQDAAAGYGPGEAPAYRELPYLSVGTALRVSNECSGISATFPVTGCAPTARLFNDHCVTCARSPRGRVADLTLAGFVALGGDLEEGCFNTTIAIGH